VNLTFAKKLLVTASIVSNAYADDNTAAQISRTRIQLIKKIRAETRLIFTFNVQEFRLYEIEVASVDSTAIKDIVHAGNNVFYFACANGQIYKKMVLIVPHDCFMTLK
jgi:hypothetical protein